jgi:hypothetical protein
MKLNVPFRCVVETVKNRENYTGSITLSPKNSQPKTFYYMVLNPYEGKNAEFSIFNDVQHEKVYAEAIGEEKQRYDPRTGRSITHYNFQLTKDDVRTGIAFVIAQIVSGAIYNAEISGKQIATFSHYWEMTISVQTSRIAENFRKAFGQ